MKINNRKIFVSSLMMILLLSMISCASASTLSLSPSSLAFHIYPGESITKNITITTDGNYAVYLSYTVSNNNSPVSLALNYTSPLIVEESAIVPVTFIFGVDSPNETFRITLTAETEVYDNPSSGSSGSSGGGGGVWIRIADDILTPAKLNGSYININGTYYYSDGRQFIKQPNFQLTNQTIIYINDTKNTNGILDTNVGTQTRGFISMLKEFFASFWHWIFG